MSKRMLHTTIWSSGQVAKLSPTARLLYIGTITLADDDGRLKGNPAFLRSQIFPYDENITVADVRNWLDEIVKAKLVTHYDVDDEQYLTHPKWEKYQTLRADRRKESHIPAPTGALPQPTDNQVTTSSQTKDGVRKGKVSKEKVSNNTLTSFAKFYALYPRKVGKDKALKAWEKLNPDEKTIAEIIAGVENGIKSEDWDVGNAERKKFIPHPATFLNGKRWQDEFTEKVVKQEKKKSTRDY